METKKELMEKLKKLEPEKLAYLEQMFRDCPQRVIRTIEYFKVPKEHNLLQGGEICNQVFVVLSGRASGIDYQLPGNAYVFMEFSGIDVLGDYEVFGDIPKYRISIRTSTVCEILTIPAGVYLEWMKNDANALFMRTRRLMRTLTNQTADERKYLFLSCKDRLILYLVAQYEKHGRNITYILPKKQPELAERIGFNVRTIQRTIQELEKAGLVLPTAGKISISYDHYLKLKEYAERNLMY